MPASYPNSLKLFTPRQDRVDIVEAGDVDDLQDEIAAIQSILGTNPHVTGIGVAQTTVKGRITQVETMLTTVSGYFDGSGTLATSQIRGLDTTIANLNAAIAGKASQAALDSLTGTVNTKAAQSYVDSQVGATNANLNTEINRATAQENYLAGLISQEVTDRSNADSSEATNRANADGALANRASALEARFARLEAEYVRNAISNYASSSNYQDLYLPDNAYATNDFGVTNGHDFVGFSGTQTRFYTDCSPIPGLFALTVNSTWLGTGGSSNAGVRGIRVVTSAGSVLAAFVKGANQAPSDETLSISWIGRLSNAANYFVTPQVLQNSGGPLTLKANGASDPTAMYIARIPG